MALLSQLVQEKHDIIFGVLHLLEHFCVIASHSRLYNVILFHHLAQKKSEKPLDQAGTSNLLYKIMALFTLPVNLMQSSTKSTLSIERYVTVTNSLATSSL